MRCPNCETDNRESAKFCDECGFPLTGAIARAAAEALASEAPASSDEPKVEDAPAAEPLDDAPSEPLSEAVSQDDPEYSDDPEQLEQPEQEEAPEDAEAPESEAASDEAVEPEAQESSEKPEMPELPQVVQEADDQVPISEQNTQAIPIDLSGFDRSYDYGERLVDPGYKEPTIDWRDGGTMKMPRIEGEEQPKSRDFLESSQMKKSNKSKIILGTVIGIVAIAAIIAFATYQMQLWGGIAVSDVTGMTEADATSVLEEQGFAVRSTSVKSDDTEGLVLIMDPNAGSRAEEGSEVVIHISTAREIPAITGKDEATAQEAFANEGLENVVYEKEFSDEPAGTVLSVKPEVGTRVKSAQEVIVKVAEPYTVPEIAGMYLQEAQTTIEEAGLAHDIEYVNTTDYPDGQIIGSNPAAGTQVKGDTVVMIQVARARGVELVALTESYLAPGGTVTIGINNYAIESLDSVEYIGSETVAYTMTARPFTYILGETVSISARQISGQIIWNEDNTIASIS